MKKKIRLKKIYVKMLTVLLLLSFSIFLINKINDNVDIDNKIIEKKTFTIKVDKPQTKIKELDKKIINLINNEVERFLKENKEQKDYLIKNNLKSDLIFTYTLHKISNINTLTITENYLVSGANYDIKHYTYHFDDKQELSMDSFFKSNNYLNIISKKAYYKLLEKANEESGFELFDEETVKTGISPNEENYKNFYFTSEGLNLLFETYQVAPRSMGNVEIVIPIDEIKDLINFKYIYNEEPKIEKKRETRNLDKYKDKKLVAFTFDDGPAYSNTVNLLDELKIRNAKVSFFLLGSRINGQQDIIKRMYNEGHTIGNHSYSHANISYLSEYETFKEINNTNNLIYNITGEKSKYIRPPYGNINEALKKIAEGPIVLWSVDSEDWKYRNEESVKNNILKTVRDGSIILLHDLYPTSVNGSLLAMDELKKQGYEFVSLEELFRIRGKQESGIVNNLYK